MCSIINILLCIYIYTIYIFPWYFLGSPHSLVSLFIRVFLGLACFFSTCWMCCFHLFSGRRHAFAMSQWGGWARTVWTIKKHTKVPKCWRITYSMEHNSNIYDIYDKMNQHESFVLVLKKKDLQELVLIRFRTDSPETCFFQVYS